MDISLIITVFIVIFIIIILFRIIKGIVKLIIVSLIVAIILTGLFSFFMIRDTTDFSKGLYKGENLFLLKENDEIISAVQLNGLNLSKAKSFSKSRINDFNEYYEDKELKKILDDKYKLFVIDKDAFPIDDIELDSVISYLKAEKEDPEILKEIDQENIEDKKAAALSLLIISSMKEDALFLVKEYRQGNVDIYPETIIFKVMKLASGNDKE